MFEMNQEGKNIDIRNSMGFQLMGLFGVFFIAILVSVGLSAGLSALPFITERTSLLLGSTLQCLFAFCLPAWVVARISSRRPWNWLSVANGAPLRSFIGVAIVYVLALPAMNQLIHWNESIHFPESLSSLENALRASENAAAEVTGKLLSGMDFWQMLAAIAVVGILTGFSEELFFRGALQKIFTGDSRKKTVAVWGAAAIFSAIHFQFFGFFPRLLMGAFFGYLLVWSGSLWLAVFAHALNNSLVVLSYWINDGDDSAFESLGIASDGGFAWGAMASLLATVIFLWRFRFYFFKIQKN